MSAGLLGGVYRRENRGPIAALIGIAGIVSSTYLWAELWKNGPYPAIPLELWAFFLASTILMLVGGVEMRRWRSQ